MEADPGPLSDWRLEGVALVLLIMGGILCVRIRSHRTRTRRPDPQSTLSLVERVKTLTGGIFDPGHLPDMLGKCLQAQSGETFVVLKVLGSGGMGAVFEGRSTRAARPVEERYAIKVLLQKSLESPTQIHRFEREIAICSRLEHPGIVKVYDWGYYCPAEDVSTRVPFMVMERVDGPDLHQAMQQQKPVPLASALYWTAEILRALHAAHGAGIIHRDLKPGNIMLTATGHLKILDFGLAGRQGRNSITTSQDVLGTPRYMSPENLRARDTTAASDIYSVGVILYEMTTGQLPYDAADIWSLLAMILKKDPPLVRSLRPEVPEDLASIIVKMMARQPAQRYASAEEVLADLQPLVDRYGSVT